MSISKRTVARVANRAACIFLLICAAQAQTAITNRVTVLVGPHELHPVVRAAEDLVSDLTKVLGPGPRLVRDVAENAPVTLWVTGSENDLAGIERPKAPESFVIATARRPRGGTAIVLAGADMRGTIYAIYHFSQQYLGVDPLYFWTDHEPPRRSRVVLPSHLRESQGPPVFRNRGWFINDEDLLTGWKPGAADGTGIALSVWDKLFEALLRLKGNMIVPGTFIFPDEPQVRAATERGLIIAQHHIEVLGTNTYRWPDDKPYSFVRFPKLLEAAWEKAVETYVPNQEVLWTVGYRGRHDRPFWEDDRFAGASDRDKGRVIDEAMDAEMKIVRRHRSHPEFIMNAWDEAIGLLKEGDLQVPPGVSLVWPDDGHGTIRDEAAMAKKQGVYYHTAMHDFMANQLTEMVPPARIEEELGRAVRAGATEYLLDNTSDLRPVPMTTREVMELAWSGNKALGDPISRWCREEFGGKTAPVLAEYYKAYFAAPARYGIKDEKTMGDNAYHTLARYLLVNMIAGKTDLPVQFQYTGTYERFASALQQSAREAAPRWAHARVLALEAAPRMPAERRNFFQYHVMSELDIQEHSNLMLEEAAAAWLGDREQRHRHLQKALTEIQSVLRAFDAGEYGKWKGFYDKELFTNVRLTMAQTRLALDQLEGKAVPKNIPIQARTPDPYPILKSYQDQRRVSL